MFENIKDAMTFTKGERTAIITLAAVILLIIAANFFVANRPANVKENLHNLDSIMALHETAVEEYYNRQKTKDNGQQTLSTKDKVIESTSRKDYKLSKNTKNNFHKKVQQPQANSLSSKDLVQKPVNINSSDTTELKSLPGIGPFFARNIVAYREKLGGFIDKKQLLEVYRLDSSIFEIISPYIDIDSVSIRKIRINHDDFKTILRHPYIEYEDVKKIVNYRETKGMITNWEQYKKVVTRDDIEERLRMYLEF